MAVNLTVLRKQTMLLSVAAKLQCASGSGVTRLPLWNRVHCNKNELPSTNGNVSYLELLLTFRDEGAGDRHYLPTAGASNSTE